MNDEKLSAEESLALIHRMINLSRMKLRETGFHFILWGILVACASIFQFIVNLNQVENSSSYLVWPVISVVGISISFTYEARTRRKKLVTGMFDRIYSHVWLGFGLTLILIITLSVVNQVPPVPFILSITGLAVFISAIIYKFRPLFIGSILFWITALLCLFLSTNEQYLANALALIFGYIVPGILLSRKDVSTS